MKRLLLIINPFAGTRQGAKNLAEIVDVFCKAGYETVVATTQKAGDGTEIARERAADFDIVVASGGDGTFNEVVAGILESGVDVPIGYLPAGTTNDFAASIGLSKDIVQAARDVVTGEPRPIDIGSFNGRYFSYVASFGAFTSTSYEVSQNLKNMIGHTAYILEGMKDVLSIKPVQLRMHTSRGVYGNRYLFGAICNSTSMGGILSLDESVVDMNDGKFEVLLVKAPTNLIELNQELRALTTKNYQECPLITFFSENELRIEADAEMPWTLDGEYQEGAKNIVIKNHRSAIKIIVGNQSKI